MLAAIDRSQHEASGSLVIADESVDDRGKPGDGGMLEDAA